MPENFADQARLASERRNALRTAANEKIMNSFQKAVPGEAYLDSKTSTPYIRNNAGSTFGDRGKPVPPEGR